MDARALVPLGAHVAVSSTITGVLRPVHPPDFFREKLQHLLTNIAVFVFVQRLPEENEKHEKLRLEREQEQKAGKASAPRANSAVPPEEPRSELLVPISPPAPAPPTTPAPGSPHFSHSHPCCHQPPPASSPDRPVPAARPAPPAPRKHSRCH
ncbi:unnamed protein product [Bubo scandiacus]